MTWLSKLEAWEEKEKDEDIKRMARVIRELAERMKKAKAICNDTPEESEPLTLDDAITDILGVLSDNLSPDAKEVLDELAE